MEGSARWCLSMSWEPVGTTDALPGGRDRGPGARGCQNLCLLCEFRRNTCLGGNSTLPIKKQNKTKDKKQCNGLTPVGS